VENNQADSMELIAKFAEAEISLHPELSFIRLQLYYWHPHDIQTPHVVPGVSQRLTPENVEDLISHLQKALQDYKSMAPYSSQSQRH
jgi:hypothetical protein